MLTTEVFEKLNIGSFSMINSDELLFINAGSSLFNPNKRVTVTQTHTSQGGCASLTFQSTPSKGSNWVLEPDNHTTGSYNETLWNGETERHEIWEFNNYPTTAVATGLRG